MNIYVSETAINNGKITIFTKNWNPMLLHFATRNGI